MDIPQGYKQTELGIIPDDWEVKRISDFTSIITGGTPSTLRPEYWGGNIMWMSSGELNKKFVFDVEGRITTEGLLNSSTHMIPPFCVLIGLAGQGKTRGTAAYNYISLCTNQSIAAILPNDKYDSLYLYYVVDSKYDYLRLLSSGDGGRGGLNKNLLNSLEIVFPKTIAEQRAIAEALSDIDGLIAALDKKIAKKRLIKQGAMQQLLTGKKRLPGFSDPWVEKRLGDMGHLMNGYTFKSETYNLAGEFKIITIANVQSGYLMINACNRIIELPVDIQPHQMLKKGDILISMTGNVGRTCVVNQTKCLLNQRVGKFDIDKDFISSQFLFELLKNEHFENAMIDAGQGAAQANIGKNDIENYKCYVPRNKAEQKAIATILNDMDKEIDDLEAQRDKYRLLKSGMMQKLLTGQIRLKIK